MKVLSIITGLYFICTIIMSTIIFTKINKGHIGRHGVRTLKNGVHNMIIWFIGICICLFIHYLIEISLLTWSIVIGISICSSIYRVTEIKHLADGQSTSTESDKFFKLYFWSGIISCIYLIIVAYLIGLDVGYSLLTVSIILILFLLAMGDLLQTRGINEDSKGYVLKQSMFIFINPPISVYKAIFIAEHRKIFLINVTNNIHSIFKGMMCYIKG
ncbi:hypothetical protein A9756_08435 [Bacillus cereus]|nr:hypothetical protein A9756_08435 [Bacillus cereus]